ncbi:hypothetical protein [Dactylosporangium darangshiense]|uniref:hypothetical protein n=1 Tax=Dactylosporangium darangshiense TaxID=579108 RepID=UPI0036349F60
MAAPEVAALHPSLRGHGRADPEPDPVALALAHATEDGHDQFMRLVLRIDRAADLWNPQPHTEVLEQRQRQPKLVAIESTVRLTDHNIVESPARITQRFEQ